MDKTGRCVDIVRAGVDVIGAGVDVIRVKGVEVIRGVVVVV